MALPSAYQQVTYLESTGTQYIDLGINPLKESKTIVKWLAVSNRDGFIFGVENAFKSSSYEIYITNGYKVWSVFNNGSMSPYNEPNYSLNTVNESKIIAGEFFFNGTSIAKSSSYSLSQSRNIFLFCNNRGGSANQITLIRLYSFQFWQDGTNLSRNMVPCYRKSDNKPGLYDTVNNQFYTNAGSGEFSVGTPVIYAGGTLINGTAYNIKSGRTLINGTGYEIARGKTLISGTARDISWARLPSAYQEVEYIESSGTQYIDIGITANIGYEIVSTISTPTVSEGTRASCCWGSNAGSGESFLGANGSKWQGYAGGGSFAVGSASANTWYAVDWIARISDQKLKVDGIQLFARTQNFLCSSKVFLFCCAESSGSMGRAGKWKMKETFVYNNSGSLIRDYIPCYRKSDLVPGMYDLVNHVFYTNAGTGSFTVGSNV